MFTLPFSFSSLSLTLPQSSTLRRQTLKLRFHWRARPLLRSLRHGIVAIDSDLETCFSSDISWLPSVTTTYPVDRITRILERQCICVRPSFTLFHVSFSVSLSFSALLPPLRYISRLVSFAFTINSLVFTRCSCVCSSRFYLYFVACAKIHSSHFYCIEKINAFGLIKEFF